MTAQPLLVVGSGRREFREYAMAGIASRGPIALLDAAQPAWTASHVRSFHAVGPMTGERIVEVGRSVAERHGAAGVLTYDERYVEPAAVLARELGLPGPGVEAARACRDKWQTRQRLAAAGVGAVRARLVTTEAEATDAAAEIGLPVVLKPRALGGSIGVVRADSPEQVAAGFDTAASAVFEGAPVTQHGVLVEEYVDGPEFSIDSVVRDGRARPVFVARKTVGLAPYFEELGHVVDARGVDSLPGLEPFLRAVHGALAFRDGTTHTEVRCARDGYRVIEVNARLGGDLIPFLGGLATGVDLPAAAAAVALGGEPNLSHTREGAAAVRFLYPDRDMTLGDVRVPPDVAAWPTVVEAHVLLPTGAVLRLPPRGYLARVAVVVVAGPTADRCAAEAEELVRRIEIVELDHAG
jgi:biotin carboxylase